MVANATCSHRKQNGQLCRATPQRDRDFCYWHDPDNAEEVAQARRLGGQRRRREGAVTGAYELDGLNRLERMERVLDIATTDALALDNSVARVRTLLAIVQTGVKFYETTELDERLRNIEEVLELRRKGERKGR